MPLQISDPTEEPSLNLTPMIDIVFLLIIFFMVGTHFTTPEQRNDVQLPTTSEVQPLTSLPDEIVVNVLGKDRVVVRDEQLSLAQLEQNLRTAKANYSEQAVVLRGSGPDPYQHVMDVLAVCTRVKISKISLASQLRDPADN